MLIALALTRYFPHGGMQRDFMGILSALRDQGDQVRIYCADWSGPVPEGVELRPVKPRSLTNHGRQARFFRQVLADSEADPVDGLVAFDRMPGADICFVADDSFAARAALDHGTLYRLTARYRHFARCERALFAPSGDSVLLLVSERQRDTYLARYDTPHERLFVLDPGLLPDRRLPEMKPAQRAARREALGLAEGELGLLFVGSAFATKGLDRAITALATLRREQPSARARLLVAGDGTPRRFRRLARRLGVAQDLSFLGGRDDIGPLMQSADVLLHPARTEAAGAVLLEAIAAGLPVITTEACGHAQLVTRARAGTVLPEPFEQPALDKALLRYLDGTYRASCREAGRLYARTTNMGGMHEQAARLIAAILHRRSLRVATDG